MGFHRRCGLAVAFQRGVVLEVLSVVSDVVTGGVLCVIVFAVTVVDGVVVGVLSVTAVLVGVASVVLFLEGDGDVRIVLVVNCVQGKGVMKGFLGG